MNCGGLEKESIKAEISVKDTLSNHTYRTGEAFMNKMTDCSTSFMDSLCKARNKAVTLDERKRVALVNVFYENSSLKGKDF